MAARHEWNDAGGKTVVMADALLAGISGLESPAPMGFVLDLPAPPAVDPAAPTVVLELFKVFDQLRRNTSIVIVEHNLDLVLALANRVFALERGAVFHQGPAQPLLTDLTYRKKILWL